MAYVTFIVTQNSLGLSELLFFLPKFVSMPMFSSTPKAMSAAAAPASSSSSTQTPQSQPLKSNLQNKYTEGGTCVRGIAQIASYWHRCYVLAKKHKADLFFIQLSALITQLQHIAYLYMLTKRLTFTRACA